MLRLPKKMLFALEAVVDIAFNARPGPVQSKEVSRRQGIPPRYLEQVMQQLVHAGILKGVRGPRGGYTLARERRRISAGEVVRVVAAVDEAEDDIDNAGSALGRQVVQPLWQQAEAAAMATLDAITLEDLCRRAHDEGVDRTARSDTDFTI